MNDTQKLKLEYWSAFNDYAYEDASFSKAFKKRKPSTDHWYSVSMGSSEYHMAFLMNTQKNILAIEFSISDNKELYKQLFAKKELIEKEAECILDWRELPERKASRVLFETKVDFNNKEKWSEQFDWIKEHSIKICKAFKKQI
jgi:hypothetical protein